MRLAILCQEEPVFLGPFLREVIAAHPERIAGVFVVGRRSAGERSSTWRERLRSLHTLWMIFEPRGFIAAALIRLRARVFGRADRRSVAGLARRLGIPVHPVSDPNRPAFRERLAEIAPDAVLNQSELLLGPEILAVPPRGFLNRHASLLPRFRGRMAAFRAHAATPPTYGLTIHLVDEGVDTGGIVVQREFRDVDPAWPYPKVMRHILAAAPRLFWNAVERLERPGFEPLPNEPADAPYRFPTLGEARQYRAELRRRRIAGVSPASPDGVPPTGPR
jgi:folate-dependent phosphoribosylglycinamide formyltransferase PurN